MRSLVVHLPFLYFGTVVVAAIYIGVARIKPSFVAATLGATSRAKAS